jgi:hypothetical protein
VKVSERDIREIRKAVYDLIWQTAHLYKEAPGGKLACPQRSKLERYVDSKIMGFDFLLDKANNESGRLASGIKPNRAVAQLPFRLF